MSFYVIQFSNPKHHQLVIPDRVVLSVKDIKMTSVFTMLRKCCNHPYLLEFPLTPDGDFLIDEQIVTSCGKVLLLDRMLPTLIYRGHKVCMYYRNFVHKNFTHEIFVLQYFECLPYICCNITDKHFHILNFRYVVRNGNFLTTSFRELRYSMPMIVQGLA